MPPVEKPIVYTRHAEDVMSERQLARSWVEETVRNPDWTSADHTTVGAVRHFKPTPDAENRILRVACLETEAEIRILTAFFDRKARRPQ